MPDVCSNPFCRESGPEASGCEECARRLPTREEYKFADRIANSVVERLTEKVARRLAQLLAPQIVDMADIARSSPSRLLDVPQVAQLLGVSERTVWKLINEGELPSVKITVGEKGQGSRRVISRDVDAYVLRRAKAMKEERDG